MATGAIIAVDVGKARVGVARCDDNHIMAVPVATLHRSRWGEDIDEVTDLVDQFRATCVVVGLPRHLKGTEGAAAHDAIAWAQELDEALEKKIPIRLVDERFTTVTAHQHLLESGRSRRNHRDVVDQAAAVIILENALEAERLTGTLAGVDLADHAQRGSDTTEVL